MFYLRQSLVSERRETTAVLGEHFECIGLKADTVQFKADSVRLKADTVQFKDDIVQFKADILQFKVESSQKAAVIVAMQTKIVLIILS